MVGYLQAGSTTGAGPPLKADRSKQAGRLDALTVYGAETRTFRAHLSTRQPTVLFVYVLRRPLSKRVLASMNF